MSDNAELKREEEEFVKLDSTEKLKLVKGKAIQIASKKMADDDRRLSSKEVQSTKSLSLQEH